MKRNAEVIWTIILALFMIVFLPSAQVGAAPKPPTTDPAIMEKLNLIEEKLNQIQNTLDNIPPNWSKKIPGPDRFIVVMDGEAVLDKETGLVWGRNVPTTHPEVKTWNFNVAFEWCQSTIIGGRYGWRVPVTEELMTLIDPSKSMPDRLAPGHPFIIDMAQAPLIFWTATTLGNDTVIKYGRAVGIDQWLGNYDLPKSNQLLIWCVRGGHGYDGVEGY